MHIFKNHFEGKDTFVIGGTFTNGCQKQITPQEAQHCFTVFKVPKKQRQDVLSVLEETAADTPEHLLEVLATEQVPIHAIPDHLLTEPVVLSLLEQRRKIGVVLAGLVNNIPKKLRTDAVMKLATHVDPDTLHFVASEKMTPELLTTAVNCFARAFIYIPDELQTPELCKTAVEKDGYLLRFCNKELLTAELCMTALKTEPNVLSSIPERLMTAEMCETAVKSNFRNLHYVPERLLAVELCKLALGRSHWAAQMIPEHLRLQCREEEEQALERFHKEWDKKMTVDASMSGADQ